MYNKGVEELNLNTCFFLMFHSHTINSQRKWWEGSFVNTTNWEKHTKQEQKQAKNDLTWSECLGVANTNKTVVVDFSLKLGENPKRTVSNCQSTTSLLIHPPQAAMTYTDGGILVQLVFCCNAEACAVAASSPGQVDCRLQLVAHLLVDGASKLRTIIAVERVRRKCHATRTQLRTEEVSFSQRSLEKV